MAFTIDLLTFSNQNGHLSVLERVIHGHLQTAFFRTGSLLQDRLDVVYKSPGDEFLLCTKGTARLVVVDADGQLARYVLDPPAHGLMLLAGETCQLAGTSDDCLLLFLSAHHYTSSPITDARSYRPATTQPSV